MAGVGPWPRQAEFDDLIVSSRVIGFFDEPVEIKRGMFSNWYVNWRTLSSDVFMLDKVTDLIIDFIRHTGVDPECIYGVPDGATKWAIVSQLKWARSRPDYRQGAYAMPMGRSKPKEHGVPKDRFFVGEPRGRTLILEDVTVMGDSLVNVVNTLKAMHIEICAAMALTDRNERSAYGKSVRETLAALGVEYHAMSDAIGLLPKAFAASGASAEIGAKVEEEFRQLGVKRLRLRR